MTAHGHRRLSLHGPRCWVLSAIGGVLCGAILAWIVPGQHTIHGPAIPLWLITPFIVLLASIALMPFVHAGFWHRHYPDFAFATAGMVAAYYLAGFGSPPAGVHSSKGQLLHALKEYYAFIALVGGLFVASGGILIDVRGRRTPAANTLLLLTGSVLANVVGTTGASMLLIRPFMRINRGRLRAMHVVFFIFTVSNFGGCLTPIGDPPLYLGFIKGVPFFWTLANLWRDWVLTIGLILAAFFVYDTAVERRGTPTFTPLPTASAASDLIEAELNARPGVSVRGATGLICLALVVAAVFVDPAVSRFADYEGVPVGATLQILVAAAAWFLASKDILAANDFTFGPVKEVGLLFLGIFVTMAPALGYLSQHAGGLGITSPTHYYLATGSLSAFLDNAPTYATFLQVALAPADVTPESIRDFLAGARGTSLLHAISTGAVFFGALTYIGNGPNFMVRAIAEGSGTAMPSFFGYMGRAVLILSPILIIHWAVFVR